MVEKVWYLTVFFIMKLRYPFRQKIVTGMQEIDKFKMQMGDIQVPLEVFE